MRDVRVTVTKEDIENGARCSISRCPISLAVHRANNDANWRTGSCDMHHYEDDHWFSLPPKITKFIQDFDSGRKVEPFSFIMRFKESA